MGTRKTLVEKFLWVILTLLMALTLEKAWNLYAQVPLTDPAGYTELAQRSRIFFDTTPREPLHIFLVKLALPFSQRPETALRVLTVIFTFISFGILCLWARFTMGFWPAFLTGLGFTSCSLIAYYSVQGFNMVSYVSFLLLFLAIWDRPPHLNPLPRRGEENNIPSPHEGEGQGEGKSRMWLLGIAAGLTSLCRLEGLLVTGLCLIVDGLVRFRRDGERAIRQTAGAVLIAFLMVSPYLIQQKITHGSFLYSHHVHAAFWAHRELIAESGFRIQNVPPAGRPMGLVQFFLEKGTTHGVMRFLKGLRLAVVWYTPRLLQGAPWQWLLIPLGLLFAARHRRWKPVFLWGATILPVAFILPVDAIGPRSGVELRFLLPSIPILCALSGMGAAWLLEKARAERAPTDSSKQL